MNTGNSDIGQMNTVNTINDLSGLGRHRDGAGPIDRQRDRALRVIRRVTPEGYYRSILLGSWLAAVIVGAICWAALIALI